MAVQKDLWRRMEDFQAQSLAICSILQDWAQRAGVTIPEEAEA
jgi:hypothetical protein